MKTRRKRVIIRLLNPSQPRQIAFDRVSLAESRVFPPSSSRRIGERGLNYRKKLQRSQVMDNLVLFGLFAWLFVGRRFFREKRLLILLKLGLISIYLWTYFVFNSNTKISCWMKMNNYRINILAFIIELRFQGEKKGWKTFFSSSCTHLSIVDSLNIEIHLGVVVKVRSIYIYLKQLGHDRSIRTAVIVISN